MRIVLFGAEGQVGSECRLLLSKEGIDLVALDRTEIDLTKVEMVDVLQTLRPDAVMNLAAYTAVDRAEDEEETCRRINATAVGRMVENCRLLRIPFLHVSTDYVFDGRQAEDECYEVTSLPYPLNVYGRTKREGEVLALGYERSFVVRTAWVFGRGRNFVDTMLRLFATHREIQVVSDQIGSPTYAKDLASLLCKMIKTQEYGLYHATNEGFCSWYEFAKAISEETRKDVHIIPVTTEDYSKSGNVKATRPLRTKLSKRSLVEHGFSLLPPWRDALRRFLMEKEEGR